MEKEENVYEEISTAGQGKEGKSPLGKFKDVDALLQAYNSLEAEFTRRSQRLKQLERDGKTKGEDAPTREGIKEENPENEAQETGQISAEEILVAAGQEPQSQPAETQTEAEGGETVERSADVLGENISDGDGRTAPPSAEVYRLAMQDESVRLQIVSDYLQSLRRGAPISKGGVGALVAPPKKAKTLSDAGTMALRMFKDAGKNQF